MGLGSAMAAVGYDYFGGFDRFACGASFCKRRGNQRRGKPLSQTRDRIARAQAQLAPANGVIAQCAGLLQKFVHLAGDFSSPLDRMDERFRSQFVPILEFVENCGGSFTIPCLGLRGRLDQFVGHAAHSRNDDDHVAFEHRRLNDVHHSLDTGSICYRCAPKFHDVQGSFRISTHCFTISAMRVAKERTDHTPHHGLGGSN